MKTYIESIPHKLHRYETCGDYWQEGETLQIRVSDLGNEDYHFLIAVHELIEGYLTRKRGISEESIKAFDEEFERKRPAGDDSEPGWSPDSPYRREHALAEKIERQLAEELGLDWKDYEEAINTL